jgi:lysozyme family protein
VASFDSSFDFMMRNEDGPPPFRYKVVPDPGGNAISGVNSKSFPRDYLFISSIPQEQRGPAVEAFYRQQFWSKWLDQLNSDAVAGRVFDASVNMGKGTAVRLLQQAVAECGHVVSVDGGWGPNTVAAANACDEACLTAAFKAERVQHYQDIADNDPEKVVYLKGWLTRAEK